MPTYEYQCLKCKKPHEAYQSITAKPLRKCPKCGGKLKRLMGTGSGFLFKGSGFYITDYRSKTYQDAKKSDEAGKSASAKPSSDKSSAGKSSSEKSSSDKPSSDSASKKKT